MMHNEALKKHAAKSRLAASLYRWTERITNNRIINWEIISGALSASSIDLVSLKIAEQEYSWPCP